MGLRVFDKKANISMGFVVMAIIAVVVLMVLVFGVHKMLLPSLFATQSCEVIQGVCLPGPRCPSGTTHFRSANCVDDNGKVGIKPICCVDPLNKIKIKENTTSTELSENDKEYPSVEEWGIYYLDEQEDDNWRELTQWTPAKDPHRCFYAQGISVSDAYSNLISKLPDNKMIKFVGRLPRNIADCCKMNIRYLTEEGQTYSEGAVETNFVKKTDLTEKDTFCTTEIVFDFNKITEENIVAFEGTSSSNPDCDGMTIMSMFKVDVIGWDADSCDDKKRSNENIKGSMSALFDLNLETTIQAPEEPGEGEQEIDNNYIYFNLIERSFFGDPDRKSCDVMCYVRGSETEEIKRCDFVGITTVNDTHTPCPAVDSMKDAMSKYTPLVKWPAGEAPSEISRTRFSFGDSFNKKICLSAFYNGKEIKKTPVISKCEHLFYVDSDVYNLDYSCDLSNGCEDIDDSHCGDARNEFYKMLDEKETLGAPNWYSEAYEGNYYNPLISLSHFCSDMECFADDGDCKNCGSIHGCAGYSEEDSCEKNSCDKNPGSSCYWEERSFIFNFLVRDKCDFCPEDANGCGNLDKDDCETCYPSCLWRDNSCRLTANLAR